MENKNQPAYPPNAGWEHSEVKGLSKRELIAAMAMQGLLANDWSHYKHEDHECENLSKTAINYADALLKSLSE